MIKNKKNREYQNTDTPRGPKGRSLRDRIRQSELDDEMDNYDRFVTTRRIDFDTEID
jgi:hypothetical protein